MGEDQHQERPPGIGWDELTARLSARRGAHVEGDRVRLWPRTRARIRTLTFAALCLALGLGALLGPSEAETPVDVAAISVALTMAGLVAAWRAARPSVALEIDGAGLRVGRLFVPWSDLVMTAVGGDPRRPIVRVTVDPASGTVARIPWLRRRGLLAESSRLPVRGVQITVADSAVLPLAADELGALTAHPAWRGRRDLPRTPMRPIWEAETAKYADDPSLRVSGTALTVIEGEVERLCIDDDGVHGRMPRDARSVAWSELWELGLFSGSEPYLLLHLSPDTQQAPVPGRGWRWLAEDFPCMTLPVPLRGLPFDVLGLTGLLFAHPNGEALWRRSTGR